MSPSIAPGDLVIVRHTLRPPLPCPHHLQRSLPLFQNVGVVDRLDDRRDEHRVVVVFRGIVCPPFGSPWVDAFRSNELVPAADL